MTSWPPGRRRMAGAASLVAVVVASLAVAVVEPRLAAGTAGLAAAFLVATAVACLRPTAVAAPVLLGAALAWPVAVGRYGEALAVPVVAGVVVVAELVGASGEHRTRVVDARSAAGRRAGATAAVAAAAGTIVALASALPGPGG